MRAGPITAAAACQVVIVSCLQVIEILGFTLGRSKWVDMVVLVAMVVAYRAAFFALLKLREARST